MRFLSTMTGLFLPLLLLSQNTNITFESQMNFPGQSLANVWGYAAGGHEYALVGASQGMLIIDITTPATPVQIAQIPGPNNLWKEIKTYGSYAYVVSEGGWGVQIVNLAGLPSPPTASDYKSYYPKITPNDSVTKAHALHIDESTGFLYLYGTNQFGGKPVVVQLSSPASPWNPAYAGYYNGVGYAHDGYVNNDTMFLAHISAGKFAIVNMTNKSAPVDYGPPVTTPNAFTHNTWRSGNTIFTTDEKNDTYLTAYNIADPLDVKEQDRYRPGTGSMVHNTYIKSNYAVTSWYKDGIIIVDAARPDNLINVGNYDTYSGSGGGSDGCWGVYPYFPSGRIIASNIYGTGSNSSTGELFILTPNYQRGCYVEGMISNASTGALLGNAFVELVGTNTNTSSSNLTQTKGQYKMGRLQSGTYTLRVTLAGYQTFTASITIANGVLTSTNVALQPIAAPVELTAFDAVSGRNKTALLTWTTATEQDFAGFSVEHSTDGIDWVELVFVPGRGNSNTKQHYQYETEALTSGTHFFRLRQRDLDGKEDLSDIRKISIGSPTLQARVFPNPADGFTKLWLWQKTAQAGSLNIEILNEQLQVLRSYPKFDCSNDSCELPLEVGDLPAGNYRVRVSTVAEQLIIPLIIVR